MTKEEMKNKYSAFITEISEILGLGKPVDIIKLCMVTDNFFKPLQKQVAELKKENAELKERLKPENCLKLLAKYGYVKFTSDQLAEAKELLAKCVELYKPKSETALPTPIQVDTEQFLKNSEVDK